MVLRLWRMSAIERIGLIGCSCDLGFRVHILRAEHLLNFSVRSGLFASLSSALLKELLSCKQIAMLELFVSA